MDIDQHKTLLEAASSGASKAIASGATVALYGGFTATEIAAFGGLSVAILGFMWKIYVDRQILNIARAKRAEELALERVDSLVDHKGRGE
jgi:hypothetical protein